MRKGIETMKRYKLCWTDKGMQIAEAQGHTGVRKLEGFSASELTAMTKRMKVAGFEQDEDGWLAPEGMNHENFMVVVEGKLGETKDHSLAESIKELFHEADRLQERADAVREQGRALDEELKRRIEPRIEQWSAGLISSVELLDALEIEKRRL